MYSEELAVTGGTNYKPPRLDRGVITRYQIYEVKDHELEALKNGWDGGIYLNVGIGGFSAAAGCLISILLSDAQNTTLKTILVVSTIWVFVIGLIFFYLFYKNQPRVEKIYNEILARQHDNNSANEEAKKIECEQH